MGGSLRCGRFGTDPESLIPSGQAEFRMVASDFFLVIGWLAGMLGGLSAVVVDR